jgi:hypothetical protein
MSEGVVDRWWEYIRRPVDELGYKVPRWDLGKLTPEEVREVSHSPLSDADVSDLVVSHGLEFKPEMTRRTTFSSEIFKVNSYITISLTDMVHRSPERVRRFEAALPVEEIETSWRRLGRTGPIFTWHFFNTYLVGRELLYNLGLLHPEEDLEDARTMIDFYRRGRMARRNDGALVPKDTEDREPYLPDEVISDLAAKVRPIDEAEHKRLRRLNVTLSGYSFLYFCDARIGQHDSGPYELESGKSMIVRDFFPLGPTRYPWTSELRPPANGYSLALTYDPAKFETIEIIQFYTLFSEPEQFMNLVDEVAVIEHSADDEARVVPPEEWEGITQEISKEHLKLYQKFVSMTPEERLLNSTKTYGWDCLPFAEAAGVVEEIDWDLHPRTMEIYDRLSDDTFSGELFGKAVLANGLNGSFTPLVETDFSRRVEVPRDQQPVLQIAETAARG